MSKAERHRCVPLVHSLELICNLSPDIYLYGGARHNEFLTPLALYGKVRQHVRENLAGISLSTRLLPQKPAVYYCWTQTPILFYPSFQLLCRGLENIL